MEQIPQGDWSRSPCGMRQALPARLRMHILAAVTGKAITSGRGCRKSPSFLIGYVSIIGVERSEKSSDEGVGGVPHTPLLHNKMAA